MRERGRGGVRKKKDRKKKKKDKKEERTVQRVGKVSAKWKKSIVLED